MAQNPPNPSTHVTPCLPRYRCSDESSCLSTMPKMMLEMIATCDDGPQQPPRTRDMQTHGKLGYHDSEVVNS